MRLITILISLVTSSTVLVTGSVIPMHNGHARIASSQLEAIAGNASYLFGLQIAGAAQNVAQLGYICDDLADDQENLANVGMIPALIKQPICNAYTAQAVPSGDSLIPYIYVYNTNIFITQVLASFAGQAQYAALCETYLDYRLIDSFGLNSGLVLPAVCAEGNASQLPETEQPLAQPDPTQVNLFYNAASRIFAYQIATSARSNVDLSYLCNDEWQYNALLMAQNLNGTLVKQIVCQLSAPLSVPTAQRDITTASADAFAIILTRISSIDGYKEWMCQALNTDGMDSVGLPGAYVLSKVCA